MTLFEENDVKAEATDVFIGWSTDGLIQSDDDWYHLLSNMTTMLQVRIAGSDTIDLNLEFLNDTTSVTNLTKFAGSTEADLYQQVYNETDYYFRVTGTNMGDSYGLYFANVTDDDFDDNDNQTDATGVFIGWGTDQIIQYDEDWYHLHSNMTTILQVRIAGSDTVDLNLEIRNDTAVLSETTKSIGLDLVDLYQQVYNETDYYFRVTGTNMGDSYGLYFANVTDDNFDDNDNQTDATGVFIGWGTDQIIQYDEDWYHLHSNMNTLLQVQLSGDFGSILNIEFWDDTGYFENITKTTDEYHVFILSEIISGDDYYFRITGANLGA